MNTARFITEDEMHLVYDIFSIERELVRQKLSEEELANLVALWQGFIKNKEMKISMVFSPDNEPLAMYCARLVPKIGGWWVGATKIKHSATNFHTSAKVMQPALDLLIEDMEKLGYYKWWMVAPENHHNVRNTVMKKYSPALTRYDWFDEKIIPAGKRSDIPLFEMHRVVVHWTDVLVRMFVLKQEFREQLVKEKHAEYLKNLEQPRS